MVSCRNHRRMVEFKRAAMWSCALAFLLLVPRTTAAQGVSLEPFAGISSGPGSTAGMKVWWTDRGILGLRGAGGWLHDSGEDGGFTEGGFVLAQPVAGGPPIRSFVALDGGVAKLGGDDAYGFVRPAIGLIARPGANKWSFVIETGVSINQGRPSRWSLAGGVMFSLSRRRHTP
jgi:hypothetical protein